MRLYLVQHGKAKAKEENSDRPLSDQGISETQKIVAFIDRQLNLKVTKIYHSGKTRARQTAEHLAKILKSESGVQKTDNLEPMADPSIWAKKLMTTEDDAMLVGHLPHLSRLASLLLTGSANNAVINFKNSGFACLERDEDNHWGITWILPPGILK